MDYEAEEAEEAIEKRDEMGGIELL